MESAQQYYLGIIEPTDNPASGRYSFVPKVSISTVVELDKTQFDGLCAANRELKLHRDRLEFLDLVHWNLEEYLGLEERLLLEGLEGTRNPFRSPELDLNRRIMNLLSSIRSYLDHTEADLKRRFGADSERYARFQHLTSRLYDAQFSYRFLYRFRNFVQHCGLPLDSFGHDASPHSRTLHAAVSRSRLLDSFDWGSIRHEIESLPDKLELTELFIAHVTHLTDLHQRLCAEELPVVNRAAQLLLSIVSRLEGREGLPTAITMPRNQDRTPNLAGGRGLRFSHLPLHVDLALVFAAQLRQHHSGADDLQQ